MSELKLTGKIKVIDEIQQGTSKDGKDWQKINFVISNNDGHEGAEQIFAFEIFGEEKVQKFLEHNKEGKEVEVSFNIRTNEWKGKYFTSLQAWKVWGVEAGEHVAETVDEEEPLPF